MQASTATSDANRRGRVVLRIDAGGEIGLGHAVRTSALLDMVEQPFDLAIVGSGEVLTQWFPRARIDAPGKDSVADTAKLVENFAADLFICDHPLAPEEIWHQVRYRPDLPCVAIDDKGGRVDADLIINGTVIEELQRYCAIREGCRVLVGPGHTLVRPEFGRSRWQSDTDRHCVTVVVGSGLRASEWALFLTSGDVDMTTWGEVTLVAGSGIAALEELRENCGTRGIEFRQGLDATELANTLSSSTLALTTGGMIVYECVVVGVPSVVFPQESNLVGECAWFAEKGGVIDLGFDDGFSSVAIEQAVTQVIGNPAGRRALSDAARATMDGHGMQRAAQAISLRLQAAMLLHQPS